jgi:hypothetical protein
VDELGEFLFLACILVVNISSMSLCCRLGNRNKCLKKGRWADQEVGLFHDIKAAWNNMVFLISHNIAIFSNQRAIDLKEVDCR